MNKLTKVHKAEILKRMLKRESPMESNMGEQTPPGMGMPIGSPTIPGMEGLQMPNMGMGPQGIPQGPSAVPPIQIEKAESYDKNPVLDLGNKLLQNIGISQSTQPMEKTDLTPIDTIIKNEAEASQIWKVMGGYDSVAGKYWQELSGKSKIYNTGRDYFISSYSKYMQSPETFKKTNPRETLLINSINKIMEEQ